MTFSDNLIDLIKSSEGFRSKPYLDGGGVPTIGYGSTYHLDGSKVTMKDSPITQEQAIELLKKQLPERVNEVNSLLKVILNQNQFDSIMDFAYNLGVGHLQKSNLLRVINANPNDSTIKSEFLKWIYDNGKVVQGLVNRRNKEYSLYIKPIV